MAAPLNYHSLVRTDVLPHLPRGGKLLDVGGGDGATASAIKAAGVADRVGVIDLVPASAAAAVDFSYQGDLTDEALLNLVAHEQGSFDTLLCCDVLEHLADPWALVARLQELLKPGGTFVASIPNVRHIRALLPLLFRGRWDYTDAGILDRTHLRFFTKKSAIELMTSSGMILEQVVATPAGRRRDRLINLLSLGTLTPFLAPHYVVRVRRPN